ncbi:MAG: hypothetical protein KAJ22_01535 [Candidatus Izimaplasma sp.]|nr:hypothetical protein [Candidatus Izimaplasma bacterium]
MPTSKKRIKRNYEESTSITKNPLKTKWGKAMVLVLIFGFIGAGLVTLIITLVQAFQSI